MADQAKSRRDQPRRDYKTTSLYIQRRPPDLHWVSLKLKITRRGPMSKVHADRSFLETIFQSITPNAWHVGPQNHSPATPGQTPTRNAHSQQRHITGVRPNHGWDTDASNDSRPVLEYTSKDRPGPDDLRYVLNMQREARERQAATSHMHDGGHVPQYIPQLHFNTDQGEGHHIDRDDEWFENWAVAGECGKYLVPLKSGMVCKQTK